MARFTNMQEVPTVPRPGRAAVDSKLATLAPNTWLWALRLWYLLLCDVTPGLPMSELRGRFVAFCDLPCLTVLETLDALAESHLLVVSGKEPPSFIRDVVRSVPFQARGLITLLEREIGHIELKDVPSVRTWRQVLNFLLRPDYPTEREAKDFIRDWVDVVQSPREYPDSLGCELMYSFSMVTGESFVSDVLEHLVPAHGPGASALSLPKHRTKRLSACAKDLQLVNCPLLREVIPEEYLDELKAGDDPLPYSVVLEVPKSWKKRRVIAVESVTRMYVQKAYQHGLYWAIAHDDFWSQHIDFQHAEKSWWYVRNGSKTGSYATADLSAASDSVTRGHVADMLGASRYESLLSRLMHARSSSAVLPDGRIVPINTFATMGNAFCFPIESLVFGTLCIVAILRCGGDVTRSRFRVYGDDIVIERKYYQALAEVLSEAGFTLNAQKSFWLRDSQFRESCGLECFAGEEVTPFRLPRTFAPLKEGLESTSAWVSIANDAYRSGFFKLSAEVRRLLVTERRLAIPFTEDGSLGLIGDNNSHLCSLYLPDWQTISWAYPAHVLRTQERRFQKLALYEWLAAAQYQDTMEVDASYDTFTDRSSDRLLIKSRSENGQVKNRIAVFTAAAV